MDGAHERSKRSAWRKGRVAFEGNYQNSQTGPRKAVLYVSEKDHEQELVQLLYVVGRKRKGKKGKVPTYLSVPSGIIWPVGLLFLPCLSSREQINGRQPGLTKSLSTGTATCKVRLIFACILSGYLSTSASTHPFPPSLSLFPPREVQPGGTYYLSQGVEKGVYIS